MKIELYQIDPSLDTERVKFMSLAITAQTSGKVNPAIYYKAFSGVVDCRDLEALFTELTANYKPANYFGHSLSVSDVVHVIESEHVAPGYYFCDRIGFKSIPFEPKQGMEPHEALETLLDCLHQNWKRHIVPADAVIVAVRALRSLEVLVERESSCRFNQDGQCTFADKPMPCAYVKKSGGLTMAEPRLIDAHDLWTEIMMLPHNGDMISSEEVEKAIVDAPTVDAVPVVHGRWVSVDGTQECDEWDCSVCERRLTFGEEINAEEVYDLNNCCPTCGAKMDGERREGE